MTVTLTPTGLVLLQSNLVRTHLSYTQVTICNLRLLPLSDFFQSFHNTKPGYFFFNRVNGGYIPPKEDYMVFT